MREIEFKILENKRIAKDVFRMVLDGDTSDITAPGQFVNIRLEGFYLRRPISICDWKENELTLIYKVVGAGTEEMSYLEPGAFLDVLISLGNGFDTGKTGTKPVIVGGGVGVPPMYGLAKRLVEQGVKPAVVLGFNGKEDIFYEEAFRELGLDVTVTTADGSYGTKGFVTDAMEGFDYAYSCGPEPMLKAVHGKVTGGQFSFEARMACGFGACMGCSCKTKYGAKRICKDGPIMEWEEIVW